MSQVVAVNGYQPARVRTTYEKVISNFLKPPFAFIATQDGTVLDIDEKLKMVKIQYKDGTLYALQYGDIITRYSGAGLHINQAVVYYSKLRKGIKFKKGMPIIYNKEFFFEDFFSDNLCWMLGKNNICALMDGDGTVDDSNVISKAAGKLLTFRPVYDRPIVMSKDFVVHSFLDVGQKVDPLTPLMVFEEFEDTFSDPNKEYDEEVSRIIKSLNRSLPKAENSGEIVEIRAFYTSPINTMHPTMQKLINHIEKLSNERVKYTSDTVDPLPKNEPITNVSKLGLTEVNADTVIITYFIRDQYEHKSGDKSTLGSSGKTVASFAMDDDAYQTVGGEFKIDHKFPGLSIFNRMIPETVNVGSASLVMLKAQRELLKMYYGE